MSEEKPTFKVTDRRLFNADGTPRADIPREEQPPPAAAESPAAARTAAPSDGRATAQEASGRPFVDEQGSLDADEFREALAAATADADETPTPARSGEPRAGDAEPDPTPFANLVMFIAQPAAAAMGMTEHPGLAPGEVDLPLAKHCIDLLAVVKEKTRGNLGQQEQQIVDGLLAELRMQYVSLTSAPRPASPRGFTGGDITGGR
jgi:hypothetical protein